MTKYQALITKIQVLKELTRCPTRCYDFSPAELALIEEALETIQFLEIVFKARNQTKEKPSWNLNTIT